MDNPLYRLRTRCRRRDEGREHVFDRGVPELLRQNDDADNSAAKNAARMNLKSNHESNKE
jgi:hypothetical protein